MSEQEQETLSDAERILNYHDWSRWIQLPPIERLEKWVKIMRWLEIPEKSEPKEQEKERSQ